jgi:uncharacterized metal-binding protein
MPSGKTHDQITFLLTIPTFLAAYFFTNKVEEAILATLAMVFGGLMFGPDLDINSKQYYRWGIMRFLWWPYQKIFNHRSMFTHGIFVGTLVRIMYFFLMIVLVTFLSVCLAEIINGRELNPQFLLNNITNEFIVLVKYIPTNYLIAVLIGVWLGAASHTLADVVTTTFKQIIKSL